MGPRAASSVARVLPVRARAPARRHSGAGGREGAQVNERRSALDGLSAAEKATVLDELLAARPELREPAEAYAVQVMTDADRSAVADDVEGALQGLDIEELNTRAGYRRGPGPLPPPEAAARSLADPPPPLPPPPPRPARPAPGPPPAHLSPAAPPRPPHLRP